MPTVHISGGESTIALSREDMMTVGAVTESSAAPVPETTPQAPTEKENRYLCQSCQGSGQCSDDMNRQ